MLNIKLFTFNPFMENTYILIDETQEAVIIDPGCHNSQEKAMLKEYIESQGLKVVALLNTHGHIDHMFGNAWVKSTFDVPFVTHQGVIQELRASEQYGPAMWGINPDISPDPDRLVDDGDTFTFGNTTLEVLFTPGHSPGHISFFHRESGQLFSGDVLFERSIGRVDLPGGSMDILMDSILNKLLPLGDDVTVYPGHGGPTTLGEERAANPFILQYLNS
ncbi:MBL fold metallo-hydrolase [Pontibacter sp. G13]|uniref:MBL fold metallo-hydrolase n=1 Tax=Pontibacter sp. G13 TaxID=3074898 RepID=UPI00288BE0A3|nr:MBL fold metallo-hydrolase [Pontibacter sp. G13]WNJ16184.1 MBL fold metallo-hydrolase [Pontibacter sp. G13]